MEFFKTILFGVSGLSLIFWVCVISIWHVDKLPKLFKENEEKSLLDKVEIPQKISQGTSFMMQGSLRPYVSNTTLINTFKYARNSFLIAYFNPVESNYSNNRLYTFILISLSFMSFMLIAYGFQGIYILLGLSLE